MFRRLAEAFQNDNQGGHIEYVKDQDKYFNSLSNIVLSGTSGLKGFGEAIKSVDSDNKNYEPTFTEYPDNIFIKDSSPKLNNLAKQCSSSSLDQLIAIKNPNAGIGCGWLYTPPNRGSPYPSLSQGFIGNTEGPLEVFSPPDHKKWFFDLQLAKKQILLDKCKALKGCTDVDSEVFKGSCGYCKDTNQGVPIDNVGKPLYAGDPIGTCDPDSIITTGRSCPPPEPIVGPQPMIDRTCEPVNGRLSSACLYNQVLSGGCSDNGSLAIALSGSPSANDYIASIRDGDAVKIYNRVANPPLKLNIFAQGATTVDQVLKEVRQLAGNTKLPSNTSTGAAARDLCIQKGTINNFDFCSDLPDTTTSPFDVGCLQQLFRKMGGQPAGSTYPSSNTMPTYNSMGNLGAVKQYLNTIIQNMNSDDYNTQRNAMIQFLGISPERLIKRAPYNQGVEVFWFVQVPGAPNKVIGFLKRTIERDIIQFRGSNGNINANVPFNGPTLFSNFVQLTDIRAPSNFSTNFQVRIDDGFFIAVNQPASSDSSILSDRNIDRPGVFANIGIQGPTTYQSKACSNFNANLPNITKMFYEDCGGGGQIFNFTLQPCSGTPSFSSQFYSLTCEPRAPFLNFEVDTNKGLFQETRNPGFFSQFIGLNNLDYHMRTEEKNIVPGKKAFVRINSANSVINMPNIAYQSWGTVTFCIRLKTMPVKETLINFATGQYYYNLILTPSSGSLSQLSIEHNFTGTPTTQQPGSMLQLDTWYIISITNGVNYFDLNIFDVPSIINSKGANIGRYVRTSSTNNLFLPNATWNPAPRQPQAPCNIMVGTKGYTTWRSMYSTSSFNYDVAWIHFFSQNISGEDLYKDAMASWIFTQFPDSPNSYKTT
jgi:hypothetical protein